jgi:hypothetical protein
MLHASQPTDRTNRSEVATLKGLPREMKKENRKEYGSQVRLALQRT